MTELMQQSADGLLGTRADVFLTWTLIEGKTRDFTFFFLEFTSWSSFIVNIMCHSEEEVKPHWYFSCEADQKRVN